MHLYLGFSAGVWLLVCQVIISATSRGGDTGNDGERRLRPEYLLVFTCHDMRNFFNSAH